MSKSLFIFFYITPWQTKDRAYISYMAGQTNNRENQMDYMRFQLQRTRTGKIRLIDTEQPKDSKYYHVCEFNENERAFEICSMLNTENNRQEREGKEIASHFCFVI